MNVHSKFRGFSLQNFPLHVDQMTELGIPSDDIDCYAAMMGEALATLHWLGEMDGNDVEFVLAPLPRRRDETNNTDYTTITNVLGKHTMWMLDFDLCRSLSMDLDGVQQAVNAFFKNDPFTPRPNTKHWTAFRRQYLQTARDVICGFSGDKADLEDRLYLSSQFIELVERQEQSTMASRRENQRTDTSWTSSLVDVMEQTLRLEDRLHILESESPQARLRRLLSTKSVISTSSSYAERQQAAVGCRSPFREIGTGSIGKVFEQAGTLWAFKVLLIERSDKLWNNYIMNLRIQDSFDRIDLDTGSLELPRAAWFASKDSEFWPENLHLFPDDPTFPRRPREILCMERIFPLPQSVRDALIDLFCNPNHAAAAKSAPANKDCIVRVFIGRKRFGTSLPGGSRFFSLRNYKLHVDQISELQLDADEYATSMANALAILHWHTRIDAMDVEFVLGSTPLDLNSVRRALPLQDIARLRPGTSTFERATNTTPNFKKRVVSLWMLDFDTCGPITMNAAGVNQAVRAFIENDPYYPRPYSNDPYSERLWQIFSQRYIEKGKKVISASLQSLPQQFIHDLQPQPKDQAQLQEVDHLRRIINSLNNHHVHGLLKTPLDTIKEDSGVVGARHVAHHRPALPQRETGARKKKPDVVAEGLVEELAGAVVKDNIKYQEDWHSEFDDNT
ncbi:zinc finger protein [Aspergillus affinis]|uniref:zinc finger protein n=1 Tax=Aspergillus affinis TaxID=1070780 RepID=UPI0022FDBA9C|nr:uncharacterized protein KD926_002520 [Aspergillus affinis]KAI9036041.1 hypothetical protein KD926_002520 [Aspergillus affinis]